MIDESCGIRFVLRLTHREFTFVVVEQHASNSREVDPTAVESRRIDEIIRTPHRQWGDMVASLPQSGEFRIQQSGTSRLDWGWP